MEDLEQTPRGANRIGRPAKYPWKEWMDGGIHTIDVDASDRVEVKRRRAMLHQRAREHGMRVVTRLTLEGQLAFQFKGVESE